MEEKKEKGKKTKTVFKVWTCLVILLAVAAAGLLVAEHQMHRSWEKQDSGTGTAQCIEDLNYFSV